MIISGILTGGCLLAYIILDEDGLLSSQFYKGFKALIVTFVVSTLLAILIPSKKELYLIYGLGTTIDYVQSNDKAKELPDKAIDALNKYLDELNKEDKK